MTESLSILNRWLSISLILWSSCLLAQTKNQTSCPEPNTLYQKEADHYWYAPGGWRSLDQSFSKRIRKFMEAQWQGVNPGVLVCVYSDGYESHFPIALQAPHLYVQPSEGKWVEHKGHSTKVSKQPSHRSSDQFSWMYGCVSDQAQDCPVQIFQSSKERVETNEDVQRLLGSIKDFKDLD